MKKYFLLVIVSIVLTYVSLGKNPESNKIESFEANQIIKDARKAIGVQGLKIDSFSQKSKMSFKIAGGDGVREIVNNTDVILPDKIRIYKNGNYEFPISRTYVWNKERYKAYSESNFFGKRRVKDITDSSLDKNSINKLSGKLGLKNTDKVVKRTPKEIFDTDMWHLFFPLTLSQPFEEDLEFKFVGKAKSGNRIAYVIDVRAQTERNYRLVFDVETNHLLMMLEKFSGEKGERENKYYFSELKMMDNILIPTKINLEEKFIATSGKSKISYVYITIEDFKINPMIKESLFDID